MFDRIRLFTSADAPALGQMIHHAIHEGASGPYSAKQLRGWSPAPRDGAAMTQRLEGQFVLVAEDDKGLSGVFTLTDDGEIDFAYVRPDKKGQGLADRLYAAVFEEARRRGLSTLTVQASHIARRFFERQGWQLVETQTVTPNGVAMQNHRMVLDL